MASRWKNLRSSRKPLNNAYQTSAGDVAWRALGLLILALQRPANGPGGRAGFRLGEAPRGECDRYGRPCRLEASGPATAPGSRSAGVGARPSAEVTGAAAFPVAAHRHRAHPPHGGSASLPRNWLVCARPAAPDGAHVGRTESADPISSEIAEKIRGDP